MSFLISIFILDVYISKFELLGHLVVLFLVFCKTHILLCRGPAPADPGYSKERRHRRGSGNNCLITL